MESYKLLTIASDSLIAFWSVFMSIFPLLAKGSDDAFRPWFAAKMAKVRVGSNPGADSSQ
jgi:hypothetical protein